MLTYTVLYHRHDVAQSFRMAIGVVKKRFGRMSAEEEEEQALTEDVHFRLAQSYKEVPEWWYLIVLVVAFGLGIAGVAAYPTNTVSSLANKTDHRHPLSSSTVSSSPSSLPSPAGSSARSRGFQLR